MKVIRVKRKNVTVKATNRVVEIKTYSTMNANGKYMEIKDFDKILDKAYEHKSFIVIDNAKFAKYKDKEFETKEGTNVVIPQVKLIEGVAITDRNVAEPFITEYLKSIEVECNIDDL